MKSLFLLLALWFSVGAASGRHGIHNPKEATAATDNLPYRKQDKARVETLLQLSKWYLTRPAGHTGAVDTSLHFAELALALSNRLGALKEQGKCYLQLAVIMQEQHEYKKGKINASSAVDLFTRLNEPDLLGESYVMMWSNTTLSGGNIAERTSFLEAAAAAFQRSGNNRRAADCYKEAGDAYQIIGSVPEAIPHIKKALALYQLAGYKHLQGVYDLLGHCYSRLGDHQEGIRYGLLAIQTAEALKDTSIANCTYYNRIGQSYLDLKDTARAGYYIDKALKFAMPYQDMEVLFNLIFTKTIILYQEGRVREALDFITGMCKRYPRIVQNNGAWIASLMIPIYVDLKMYSRAKASAVLLEKALAEPGLDGQLALSGNNGLIHFYLVTGDYKRATIRNIALKKYCDTTHIKTLLANYYLYQFRIDSLSGNYLSALRQFQRYKGLYDTIFNQEKERSISQLNILYETEKKEKNIQLLKQETLLQQSRIRQAGTIQKMTYWGVALLLLIVAGLYYGYHLKQKNNRKLQEQQEEINRKNHSLERLVAEKEWLIREIHHRVKNNLHMVVGLLASKTEFLKSDEALEAITESQHRVQAMSIIHQKLYQTESLSTIDMPSYVLELVEYLQSSFGKEPLIRFKLDIAQTALPLSHSIPLGLVLNEAITNAIKYAFPDQRSGNISITLEETGPRSYVLVIADDGIGVPAHINLKKSSSLGMTLMQGLCDDIGGLMKISTDRGVQIEIAFRIKP